MRVRSVLHILGQLLQIVGLSMIIPLLWGLYYRETESWIFVFCILITFSFGTFLKLVFEMEDIRLLKDLGWCPYVDYY